MTESKLANPAPLGLFGFGMTTVLLNFVVNARLHPIDSVIFGMGIFYGGLAQIIAGVLEYKKGNTFGTVAFSSYGFFWLSFVALNWLSVGSPVWPFWGYNGSPWVPSYESLMAYFIMWGLFTFAMFFGTLKANRALQTVFATLTILFFLLALKFGLLASGTTMNLDLLTQVTGIEGIICGLSAFYLATAEVLNEMHGRKVVPIGEVI